MYQSQAISPTQSASMTGKSLQNSVVMMEQQQLKNTLIVGWNVESVNLYDRLIGANALGFNVRGFVAPNGVKTKSHYKNVPVVSDLSDFSETVRRLDITEMLIVLSPAEKQHISRIIQLCSENNIDYRIVSDTYDAEYEHVIRHIISDVWRAQEFGFRRLIDILGSLLLLILLLPLFIIVAIAIKVESKGPVFYSQQRYGKKGKVFKVYKFRSMVQDAEKQSGPTWASKNDPRITRVGAFMRKTRIDELPQLMNVLVGDMSFIGPRPERPFFADMFKKQIPFYMNRLRTKPGITGLAQVTVGYDETLDDVKEKIAKDIEYIDNKNSFQMNLKIIWKTILVVLMGEGQ